jgi:hypothetical protein
MIFRKAQRLALKGRFWKFLRRKSRLKRYVFFASSNADFVNKGSFGACFAVLIECVLHIDDIGR